MKIEHFIVAYAAIGFLLWLWAFVDDLITGNHHRGGTGVLVQTLFAMIVGWPLFAHDLLKPRGRR